MAPLKDLEHLHSSLSTGLRPIMTSLNGDNSWLLSFPRPASEQRTLRKAYYHIVFEPWLAGPATILSSWLINIALASAPAFATVDAIEEAIRQIEEAAWKQLGLDIQSEEKEKVDEYAGGIDLILLSFHYDDHLHKPTLLTFDPRIPVLATPEAANIITKLQHFTSISLISNFPPNNDTKTWKTETLHTGTPVPEWLSFLRFLGHHELNFVFALIWSRSCSSESEQGQEGEGKIIHEAIFSSPHGLRPSQDPDECTPLDNFLATSPSITPLALLHGSKESWAAGAQNTYGVKSGLRLFRQLREPRYWVLSHSSILGYSGLVMRMLGVRDVPKTVEWGLEEEKRSGGGDGKRPDVVEVENGGFLVLK